MENPFLFVNPSEDNIEVSEQSFSFTLSSLKKTDKETLLAIIETLTNTNDTLRKYIRLLEKRYE